jgi:Putative beta-barrel porin 2
LLCLEVYMRKRFVCLKIFHSAIVILSCLLAATGTQAAESMLIPEILIKQTYNDNINFSTTEEKNYLILTVTPILRWNSQTERTGITANAEMDVIRYGQRAQS